MPIGIIINATVILVGGLLGTQFGKYIPERMQESLSLLFGIASIGIGITLIVRLNALPAVILSLLLGTIVGEAIQLENRIKSGSQKLKVAVERFSHKSEEEDDAFLDKFISLLVLFCTGSTGLMGAMAEGMGDSSILLAKSVLDFFASGIFAATMGAMVMVIALPQVVLFLCLFFLARLILPMATPNMIADFYGAGGIIALVTGFRIAEIKSMRVSNMLPALLLVMPISWMWFRLFGI